MAMFKEGALQLRRRNISAPADPGFIKVYCDIGGSLYTVDEYGTSAYIKGVANISTGIFGGQPSLSINNLSATITSCNVILNSNSDYSGTYNAYTLSGDIVQLYDTNDMQYVCITMINGTPKLVVETSWLNINGSNKTAVFLVWKDLGNADWHQLYYGSEGSGLPNKILDSIINTTQLRVATNGRLTLTETPTRIINVSKCDVFFGIERVSVPEFTSSIHSFYELVKIGNSWSSTTKTQYDNQYFNDVTGKSLLGSGKYGVRWFYSLIDDYPQVVYTLGLSAYDSISTAQMEDPPDLPSYIADRNLLIGRIIVGAGASSGLVEGVFGKFHFKPLTSDHNSLNGLQGGTYGQYYHLTSADYNQLTTSGVAKNHNHNYVHTQSTPATMWSINHNLGHITEVSVYINNQKVEPSVAYSDFNTTIITFSIALTGVAVLI